jgi:hypothetical protein
MARQHKPSWDRWNTSGSRWEKPIDGAAADDGGLHPQSLLRPEAEEDLARLPEI